jgi:thioredoxin-like negative regulator of GroEL
MVERLLLTLLLMGAAVAAYELLRRVHQRRLNRLPAAEVDGPILLYFRSDSCAACPTQARYLEQLGQVWHGRFTLRKIDADVERETAVRYGILTLPTTILLDAQGIVQAINYGLTNTAKLAGQLEALGQRP